MNVIPTASTSQLRSGEVAAISLPSVKLALNCKEVLLCTDFSRASEAAMETAVRICSRTSAHVSMLHVCELGPMSAVTEEGMDYIEGLYAQRRRSLGEAAARLRARGVQVDTIFLDGSAPTVILEQIDWLRADLVVLGTTAAKGLERLVFGSTAEAVFRRATCPVLTVNANCFAPDAALEFGPIVFATEFNEQDQRCARFAAGMANAFDVPLHCVHVLPSLVHGADRIAAEGVMVNALRALTDYGTLCLQQPVCSVLSGSSLSQTLAAYADATGAQMIVLGVRRKSRLAAHLPPRRTERILMTAPCAVVTLSCPTDRQLAAQKQIGRNASLD